MIRKDDELKGWGILSLLFFALKTILIIERMVFKMNLLSKISYYKIQFLSTRIEIRSTLNVLGLCSDDRAERKNKEDVFKVMELTQNLNGKDVMKLIKYSKKHPVK